MFYDILFNGREYEKSAKKKKPSKKKIHEKKQKVNVSLVIHHKTR